jgi:hypothetical protein
VKAIRRDSTLTRLRLRLRRAKPGPACPVGEGPSSPFEGEGLRSAYLAASAARGRSLWSACGEVLKGRRHRFGSTTDEPRRGGAIQSGVTAAALHMGTPFLLRVPSSRFPVPPFPPHRLPVPPFPLPVPSSRFPVPPFLLRVPCSRFQVPPFPL